MENLIFLSRLKVRRLKVRASTAHKSFIQLLLLQRPNIVQNNKRTISLKNQFDELNQGLRPSFNRGGIRGVDFLLNRFFLAVHIINYSLLYM